MRGQNTIKVYGQSEWVSSVGQPENGSMAALSASMVCVCSFRSASM
jgi:hypothetical protein